MQRLLPVVVAAVVAVALIAGAVMLAAGDGPDAFSVGSYRVSQSEVDAELAALADNDALAALVEQGGGESLGSTPGAVRSSLGASWIGLRVAQEVAARDIKRRDATITANDRVVGHGFAVQSVGGPDVFRTLPASLRRDLDARWTPIAVIAGEEADCPSGRYVSHILVRTQQEATDLAEELAGGASFSALARERSGDTASAASGGRLGCLDDLGDLVAPFLAAAETQPLDEVSDPVETEFGFHLILVNDEFFASAPSDATLNAVGRRARRASVEVDPRYGTWDGANGQVVPPSPTAAAG